VLAVIKLRILTMCIRICVIICVEVGNGPWLRVDPRDPPATVVVRGGVCIHNSLVRPGAAELGIVSRGVGDGTVPE